MNAPVGFDLSPTIAWYSDRIAELSAKLPSSPADECPIHFEYLGNGGTGLKIGDLRALVNLLPQGAIERSGLVRIEWHGQHWFPKDMNPDEPHAVQTLDEALSPTAIIPSAVGHVPMERYPRLGSTIFMFEMDSNIVPLEVQRVIYSQAFLHEMVHTIVTPSLYRDIEIQLPDGQIIGAGEYLLEMQNEMRRSGPISHYSSAYWHNGEPNDVRGLNEEVTELLTAMILGFAMPPANRTALPLEERPKLMEMLHAFLHAAPHESQGEPAQA